jgi:hypothetical protein
MKSRIPVLCLATVFITAAATAAPLYYGTALTGAAEAPPNASPGTGSALVILDVVAHTLSVDIIFADLIGTTTASHIHCCTAAPFAGTAGVATVTPSFTGFPLGVTAGTYSHVFDTSAAVGTWNPAFITANGGTPLGAEAALAAGLAAGTAYMNVHSTFRPGGEIRGFLEPVPEPGTMGLMGTALAGLLLGLNRRRRALR